MQSGIYRAVVESRRRQVFVYNCDELIVSSEFNVPLSLGGGKFMMRWETWTEMGRFQNDDNFFCVQSVDWHR